jgi:hypothetical protein
VALPEPDPGDDTTWDRGAPEYYQQHPPTPVFAPTPPIRRRKKRPTTHPFVLDVKGDFEDSRPSTYRDDGYLKPKRSSLPDIVVSQPSLARVTKAWMARPPSSELIVPASPTCWS